MDAMKLLIADGNEEFRRALAAELQGAYHVRCCGDGKEALSLLRSFVPDAGNAARPSDAGDQSAAFPEHSFQTPGLRIPPGSHSEDDEGPRPAHYKGAVSGGGRGLRLQGHPRGALHPKRHRYRMEAAGRPCLAKNPSLLVIFPVFR